MKAMQKQGPLAVPASFCCPTLLVRLHRLPLWRWCPCLCGELSEEWSQWSAYTLSGKDADRGVWRGEGGGVCPFLEEDLVILVKSSCVAVAQPLYKPRCFMLSSVFLPVKITQLAILILSKCSPIPISLLCSQGHGRGETFWTRHIEFQEVCEMSI